MTLTSVTIPILDQNTDIFYPNHSHSSLTGLPASTLVPCLSILFTRTPFLHITSSLNLPMASHRMRNNVQGSYDLAARCLLNLTSNHVSFPQSAPVLLGFLMYLENNKLVPTSGPLHSCSHGFEYSAPGYWHHSLLQGLFKKGNYPENFSQTICLSNHLFSHLKLLLDLSFCCNIILINTNTEFIVCLPK